MRQPVYPVLLGFILMGSVWVFVKMAHIPTISLKPANNAMKGALNALIQPQYVQNVFHPTICS